MSELPSGAVTLLEPLKMGSGDEARASLFSTRARQLGPAHGRGQSLEGLPQIPAGDEVENDRAYRSAAVRWILADPLRFVGRMDDRLVRTFDPVTKLIHGTFGSVSQRWTVRVIWLVLLAFVVWGLVLHHRGPWLVPISIVAATLLLVLGFGGGFRFLVPVVPFLSIWGVAGLTDVITVRLQDHRPRGVAA
jgi:hypothetical protein